MDIGAVSATGLANYQTVLSSYARSAASPTTRTGSSASTSASEQSAAVLQALTAAYSNLSGTNGTQSAPDTLSFLAGSDALASLARGIYSASTANGDTTLPDSSLSAALASVGGLNSTSASILFSGQGNSGSDGFSSAAINLDATLALASYTNRQNGIPDGTIGAAAAKLASGIDSTQASSVQAAIQAAQAVSLTSTLNLIG